MDRPGVRDSHMKTAWCSGVEGIDQMPTLCAGIEYVEHKSRRCDARPMQPVLFSTDLG